jgi:hypothetical protein
VNGLPLPAQVVGHEVAPEIILFPRVIPWCAELILDAERLNKWRKSTQQRNLSTAGTFTGDYRNSDSLDLNRGTHPDFLPYEQGLVAATHACVGVYVSYNKHVQVNIDTGFEMLRYQPGQHFHEHVDVIVGVDQYIRQVSCIVFLNEGFQGGEIEFSRQKLKLRPTAGDILLFPANFCFPHAVHDVTAGVRYSAVTWFSGDMRFPVTR